MTILGLAEAMRTKCTRDECNDRVIRGKRGNISEDGAGFSAMVLLKSKTAIKNAHTVLSKFCKRTQNGDTEAVYYFDDIAAALPDLQTALLKFIRIRQKKQYRPETLEKMRAQGRLLASNLSKTAENNVQ